MKLHLKQIPPDGAHLEGEEDCLIPELESEGIRCVGPMGHKIDVGISDGSLWAKGTLKQKVEMTCVACLERFVHQIAAPDFTVHTELGGPEVVDLTPFMREDILLNLPAHPRCDREGDRQCKAAHHHAPPLEVKPKLDWSALDKLKIENR